MSKNIVKNFSIIFIIFMLILSFAIPVFADEDTYDGTSKFDMKKGLTQIDEIGDKTPVTTDADGKKSDTISTKMTNIMGTVYNVVKIIAVSMALIMLAVLAIKYMSAAPNDKAEIKKHAVVYIVGAVCLFGAAGILQVIQSATGMFN